MNFDIILQAKLRKAYNWYRSMTLGNKKEFYKWDQLHHRDGLAMNNAQFDSEALCISIEPYYLMEPYSFDGELPKIWNYAISPTLGHELGHGFDRMRTEIDASGIYGIIREGSEPEKRDCKSSEDA